MFDDKGGEMYPKSMQMMPLGRGRNGKCNAKGCMVIGGGYLVNMGEKCNLMIPWTKVQIFHCSYGSNHTQAFVLQFFLQLVSRAFQNEH